LTSSFQDDLIYSWKDAGAVQFPENFSLPGGFKLADTGMEYCDVQTATGDYSCLRVSLPAALVLGCADSQRRLQLS